MKKLLQIAPIIILVLSPLFALAQTAATVEHDLYLGVRSSEVTLLQQKLQGLGYFPSTVQLSGYFGAITQKAVQSFQGANNISTTGYVGPLTRRALAKQGAAQVSFSQCLPSDIKLGDIVDASITGYANGQPVGLQKVTVEQKLNGLKAVCNSGNILVDASGKQISFYHLTGCWGNQPYNYQDILQKQQDEINALKQQYTVIEMTCNPSGIPIP